MDTFVYLVGWDEYSVLGADLAGGEELLCGGDFAKGVVAAEDLETISWRFESMLDGRSVHILL